MTVQDRVAPARTGDTLAVTAASGRGRPVEAFAIVGLGSWGICVLERTVARARRSDRTLRVHVVDPGPVAGGIYTAQQPDFLILNNPCSQLSLDASPVRGESRLYGMGLYEWAVARGYRWVGHECRVDASGTALEPGDYLPRRLMGEYLTWFYEALVADAPDNLTIVRHHAAAVDVRPGRDGGESVVLDDGSVLEVDHVVLTTGHTLNDEPLVGDHGLRYLRPYPVTHFDDEVPPGAPVAVEGMGLVAFDLVTALTQGRGGTYEEDGSGGLRYVASGREPVVVLFSRSGVPYCAKSATGVDPYGGYRPVVATPEAFDALIHPGGRRVHRLVDVRREVLPLVFAEMQVRFHAHSAHLARGEEAATAVREALGRAWADGTFDDEVARLEALHGAFDPADHLFAGLGERYGSADEYEGVTRRRIALDLAEAVAPGGSPVKAAQETFRILRDQVRSVVEFGGLTLDSFRDFQANIRSRINRLEAGPPALRTRQLLALMEAGVVRIPLGPDPEVVAVGDDGVTLRSTALDEPTEVTVLGVVRGHLDLPSLVRSVSPLLVRLAASGRLTPLSYGDVTVGSVDVDEHCHPRDAAGLVQPTLSVFGVLTEGTRYFTHYLPSPRSRMRAVLDAQACVEELVG